MTNIYELTTSGGLTPDASPESPASGMKDGVLRWVRMVGPQSNELQAAVSALDLPDTVWETLHTGEARSQVVTYHQSVAVTFPLLPNKERRSIGLRAVCTETTLITVEEVALPAIDKVVTERSHVARPGLTPSDLFIEVLDAAVSGEGLVYLSLRRQFDELAEAVEDSPLKVSPDALLAMRRQVAQLSMLWEDQSYGAMELQRHLTHIAPSDNARELLRDLISDAGLGLRLLAQMESRLRDLRQHQQQFLQESTNRRLNMLAILSSIYMPATLIAGIYGMNFDHIPVTTLSHGYYVIMAFMAVVVLGHFWYFYHRGWFK